MTLSFLRLLHVRFISVLNITPLGDKTHLNMGGTTMARHEAPSELTSSALMRQMRAGAQTILTLTVVLLGFSAGNVRANPAVFERTLKSTALVVSSSGSIGTAALIDAKRRWLLTNFHVVEKQKQVAVYFPVYRDGSLITDPNEYLKQKAKWGLIGDVISRDKKRDLAVIELKKLPRVVTSLPLAGRSAKPGETVHSIGNSGIGNGTLWRYSNGYVRQVYAAKFRSHGQDGSVIEAEATVVETQVPCNPGDSGGPVVNEKGELVGVSQSIFRDQQLVTYSIDVREVRAFLRTVRVTRSGR
jgi:serine protease Do